MSFHRKYEQCSIFDFQLMLILNNLKNRCSNEFVTLLSSNVISRESRIKDWKWFSFRLKHGATKLEEISPSHIHKKSQRLEQLQSTIQIHFINHSWTRSRNCKMAIFNSFTNNILIFFFHFSNIQIEPIIMMGATDARFLRRVCIPKLIQFFDNDTVCAHLF